MTARLDPDEKARRAAARKAKQLSREQKHERQIARDRAYYQANAEARREYARAYRAAHADALREARRLRHEAAPHKRAERDRKYYWTRVASNRAEVNAKARAARDRALVQRRLQGAFRAARRRALKRCSPGAGSITLAAWKETLKLFGHRCAYCLRPAAEADHLEPLALGGADAIENLVPACRPCNRSKGARPLLLWTLKRSISQLARQGRGGR